MIRDTLPASGTSRVRPWQRILHEHGPQGSNRLLVMVPAARCLVPPVIAGTGTPRADPVTPRGPVRPLPLLRQGAPWRAAHPPHNPSGEPRSDPTEIGRAHV